MTESSSSSTRSSTSWELPIVTISRLKVPSLERAKFSHISEEEKKRYFENFVNKIISDLNKNRNQESSQFKHLTLPEQSRVNLYTVKAYCRRVERTSAFGKILKRDNSGINLKEANIEFLIFIGRIVERVGRRRKPIEDFYACTTGGAWQHVRPYSNCAFPQRLAQRFVDPKITSLSARHLVGGQLSSKSHYRDDPHLSRLDSLTRFVTGFNSSFKPSSSVSGLLFPSSSDQALPKVGIEIKTGSIRIQKKLEFRELLDLLEHFSKLYIFEETYDREKSKEKNDPGFYFLNYVQKAPPYIKQSLDELLLDQLWDWFRTKSIPEAFFWHRYSEDFLHSPIFILFHKDDKVGTWHSPPKLGEILQKLRQIPKLQKVGDKKTFLTVLSNVRFGYIRRGEIQKEAIQNFLEMEVNTPEGRTYFRVNGLWLWISAEHFFVLHHEFNELLKRSLLKSEQFDLLPSPWISEQKYAAFSWKELQNLIPPDRTPQSVWNRVYSVLEELSLNKKNVQPSKKRPASSKEKEKSKRRKTAENSFSALSPASSSTPAAPLLPRVKTQLVVSTNPETLNQFRLPPPLVSFLEDKYRLYRSIKKEEDYNRSYLETPNFFLGDQIEPSSQPLELFDLLRVTAQGIYLIHVKEKFGQKTRDACSQIYNAAQAIRRSMDAGDNHSNILEEFWNTVIDYQSTNGEENFRTKAKQKYLKLGKENFFSLFKGKKKIVFVYAFLDTHSQERFLKNEIDFVPTFSAKDFENIEELKGSFSSEWIIEKLKEKKYLDSRGNFSNASFEAAEKGFFLHKEMSKKQTRAVFYRICRKLSPFRSSIARMELIRMEEELRKLNFDFKIFQISRPKDASQLSINEGSDEISLSDSPNLSSQESEDEIEMDGHIFSKVFTTGDGSCALHALLGDIRENQCAYRSSEYDSPKKFFANKFLKNYRQKPEINQKFRASLLDRLESALRGESNSEIISLFLEGNIGNDYNEFHEAYKKAENEFFNQKDEYLTREGHIWNDIFQKYPSLKQKREFSNLVFEMSKEIEKLKKAQNPTKKTGKKQLPPSKNTLFNYGYLKSFSGHEKLLTQKMDNQRDYIFDRMNHFVGSFPEANQNELLQKLNDAQNLYQERMQLPKKLTSMKRSFIQKTEVRNHYFRCLKDRDYWYSTQELLLAAKVLQKKIKILAYANQQLVIADCNFSGECKDAIIIFHESGHFSRCIPKENEELSETQNPEINSEPSISTSSN